MSSLLLSSAEREAPITEAAAMRRAVELAWKGWGRVSPNPMVGCVLLRDGKVVGEGWHPSFGGIHAEPMALAVARDDAVGATALVTLEPCTHYGKQPPCTPALVEAGVARVVAAIPDPNPQAQGAAAIFSTAGIDYTTGLLAAEATYQNASFLHSFSPSELPWVALKLATSLDGKIADRQGRSKWISSGAAREWVHWLRAGFDAVAVGGMTARTDDPTLTVRGEVQPRINPTRVVFWGTTGLDLSKLTRLRDSASYGPIILVVPPGNQSPAGLPSPDISVLEATSLREALVLLKRRGVNSILVEGGGRLAAALLAQDLVHRCYLVQAPIFIGNDGRPMVADSQFPTLDGLHRWRVVERRPMGDDQLTVIEPS